MITLATQAKAAVAMLKAALLDMAITYRGSSLFGQRYGVHMKLIFIMVVTILMATAFFSLVWPQTLPHQPNIKLFTPYVPMVKMTIDTYRPARSRVAAAAANPTVATALEMVICQVRSLNRPEDQETITVMTPAMRYGGQVRTRVTVVLRPSVSTTVGNCAWKLD